MYFDSLEANLTQEDPMTLDFCSRCGKALELSTREIAQRIGISESHTSKQSRIWAGEEGICAKNKRGHWRWCEACFPEAFRRHGFNSTRSMSDSITVPPSGSHPHLLHPRFPVVPVAPPQPAKAMDQPLGRPGAKAPRSVVAPGSPVPGRPLLAGRSDGARSTQSTPQAQPPVKRPQIADFQEQQKRTPKASICACLAVMGSSEALLKIRGMRLENVELALLEDEYAQLDRGFQVKLKNRHSELLVPDLAKETIKLVFSRYPYLLFLLGLFAIVCFLAIKPVNNERKEAPSTSQALSGYQVRVGS